MSQAALTLDPAPPPVVPVADLPLAAAPVAERWPSAYLLALALLMTALKLVCASLTIGSGDVFQFRNFAEGLQTLDVCSLYHQTLMFNHTPLTACYLSILGGFANSSIQQFAFFLRLPGILADLALVLFFLSQRRREPLASLPGWALALFIASPVSFLVTGFHGNFDAVVVFFLVLAAWMCLRAQPLASALFLALSLQVKVPALVVLPVFLVYWYRQGAFIRFTLTLVGICVVGWIEPLTRDPLVFFRNVLGYSSYWGGWGVSYWLMHTAAWSLRPMPLGQATFPEQVITQLLKFTILGGITLLAWTRRPFSAEKMFPVLAVAWSLFFFLTPGAGAQYVIWLAPFVLLYRPRWYLGMTLCCSLSCYLYYRTICHSWLLYRDFSTPHDFWVWSPWLLWAWAGTAYGLLVFWRETRPANPDRACFSGLS